MRPSTDHVSPQPAPVRPQEHDLHTLQSRVSAEFREMPGLRLTLAQASRLFSIDPGRCERVLGALVEGGVLATSGDAFARADSGARYA